MTCTMMSKLDIACPSDQGAEQVAVSRRSKSVDAQRRIANSLTTILLHAEAIKLRSAGMGHEEAEVVSSACQVVNSAKQLWDVMEEIMRSDITEGPLL